MKKFTTNCDVGSIRIFSKDFVVHYRNGVGDVPTETRIKERKTKRWVDGEFIGMFIVRKPNTVFLSAYDCADQPVYSFPVGRWFVNLTAPAKLLIEFVDKDIR